MDVCWLEFLFPQWWCHLSTAEPLQGDTSHRWSPSHTAFNLLKADSSLKWTLFLVPRVSAYGRLDCRCNNLLYTYWDLHTEKPQSKFSFVNRCKPIKCRVSLFPHVRKAARPIRSHVSWFFTCEMYGKLKFSFKAGWRGFVHRTSHRFASLERANSFYSHFFHR